MMTAAETSVLTSGFKVWTEEELLYAVSAGLLKEVSDTTTTIEAPNIIGANVKLVVHGAVGAPSGTVDIDVASLRLPAATGSMTLSGHTLTLASGTWAAMGFKVGQQVFIEGSDDNSGPRVISTVSANVLTVGGDTFTSETANLTVSITMTDDQRVALAAAERNDVVYLSPVDNLTPASHTPSAPARPAISPVCSQATSSRCWATARTPPRGSSSIRSPR